MERRTTYHVAATLWMNPDAADKVHAHNAKVAELEQAKAAHLKQLADLRNGDPLALETDVLVTARGDLLCERLRLLKSESHLARQTAELCGELVPLAIAAAGERELDAEKMLVKTIDALRKARSLPRELDDLQAHKLNLEARNTGPYRELADGASDVRLAADAMRRLARACEQAVPELSEQAKRLLVSELAGV